MKNSLHAKSKTKSTEGVKIRAVRVVKRLKSEIYVLTVVPTKSDNDAIFCLQLPSKH